jgi:hypothetical protein
MVAAIAAGFTGLLSLFNIGGRFFWASFSDYIGRKNTYYTFFLLGIALYASAPWFAQIGSKTLFVLAFGVILSMYGGGFATVPAYLADIFGTQFVGAIHGRLLTAWSTAGIVGPVVVNYIREFEIAAGVPRDRVYDVTMYAPGKALSLGPFLPVRPRVRVDDAASGADHARGRRSEPARRMSGHDLGLVRPLLSAAGRAFSKDRKTPHRQGPEISASDLALAVRGHAMSHHRNVRSCQATEPPSGILTTSLFDCERLYRPEILARATGGTFRDKRPAFTGSPRRRWPTAFPGW